MDQIEHKDIVAQLRIHRGVWSEKDEDVWRIEILRRMQHKQFQHGDLLSVDWSIILAAFLEVGINLRELLKKDIQNHIKEILVYDWH